MFTNILTVAFPKIKKLPLDVYVTTFTIIFVLLASSLASAQSFIVSAGFEDGVVGEYRNNAHQPTRLRTFSTLGIVGAVIQDETDDGRFGGSQGNDYSVTVTFQFSDGTTETFNAAVNWRDTDGSDVAAIGLTAQDGVIDGTSYVAGDGLHKTYLLKFLGSSRNYVDTNSGDRGSVISGNAATVGLFTELNVYASAKPASTNPSGLTSTINAVPSSILANGISNSTITVQAKDINGNSLSTGGNSVVLSATSGSLSAVSDIGDGTYTAILTSSTEVEVAIVSGSIDASSISDTASVTFTGNSSISGTVRNSAGNGVSGRSVRLLTNSDQIVQTVTTGPSGTYIFSGLSSGTYKVEFESAGNYKAKSKSSVGIARSYFVSSIAVQTNDSQLTAIDAVVIDPSGVVYDAVTRLPVPGAVVTFKYNGSLVNDSWLDQTLGGPNTQTTSADGQYSFVLNANALSGVYTIDIAEPSGYSFESLAIPAQIGAYDPGTGGNLVLIQPQSTAPTGSQSTLYYLDFNFVIGDSSATSSNGVINNHIPLDPSPSVSIANTTQAAESSTNGVVTVSLSTASATDTVISYSVAGTAVAGADYTALPGTVTIAANATSATIGVPVIDDSLVEGDETVIITLTGLISGTASLSTNSSNLTATNTIADDDSNSAPIYTNQNADGGAGYSFDYPAGSSASDVLGQVTGADADDETLLFSITESNSDGWYRIDGATGEIRLTATGVNSLANNYEQMPNTHLLIITMTDGLSSIRVQVSLDETDDDNVAPSIRGPSGDQGAPESAISINEGLTRVSTFTADERVAWSVDGGSEEHKFEINPETGELSFLDPPDYENPTDGDGNNTYLVRIKATDAAGNVSYQTLTVTIINVDEIGLKLEEIDDNFRASLRAYVIGGLSDMLSFNERFLRNRYDSDCHDPRDFSGSGVANQNGANINLGYSQQISECYQRDQIYFDAGLIYSNVSGSWNSRVFSALSFETKMNNDFTLGFSALASRSSDTLIDFKHSSISDKSLQGTVYARYSLSDGIRTSGFLGLGGSWYNFSLRENDGFFLDGSILGRRLTYGWMLSGDLMLGDRVIITTDAIFSRALETLQSGSLAANYLGENRAGISFDLGKIDVTRLSLPVTAEITLAESSQEFGATTSLLLSYGLLCEDLAAGSSAIECGYQLSAKLIGDEGTRRNRFYAEYAWESIDSMHRRLIGLGYAWAFGDQDGLELAFRVDQAKADSVGRGVGATMTLSGFF